MESDLDARRRFTGVMTSTRTAATAAALSATLSLAGTSWVVAVREMDGMDMGVATDLGSFAFFVAAWVPMMAAMMLPGAAPAALASARAIGRVRAVPMFAGSYLVVWTAVGLVVYALYQPHGTLAAGSLTVAAGVYEPTPLKRYCRRRCRERVGSGFEFGLYCAGSSIGLMVMLLALGAMSVSGCPSSLSSFSPRSSCRRQPPSTCRSRSRSSRLESSSPSRRRRFPVLRQRCEGSRAPRLMASIQQQEGKER
jgi:predicted metal-binding membrane protein